MNNLKRYIDLLGPTMDEAEVQNLKEILLMLVSIVENLEQQQGERENE